MSNTNEIFENLMNGNLTDAQLRAKKISFVKLLSAARDWFREEEEALKTVCYLKGKISFNDLCAD